MNRIKVDPKRPASHPGYEDALRKGRARLRTMKFESEGDKRDYERKVRANPNNVMGLPTFYPPERIQVFVGVMDSERDREIQFLERIRQAQLRDVEMTCSSCGRVTVHVIGPPGHSFCKKCGMKVSAHGMSY